MGIICQLFYFPFSLMTLQNGKLVLFADDLNLVVSANATNDLQIKANSDLSAIHNWFIRNRLVPNLQNFNFMIMGCPRKAIEIHLKLGDLQLKRVSETKILGIILNHNLRFDEKINAMSISISNRIKFLSRLRYYLPQKTLNFIFKALVFSIFDYCDFVWRFTYNIHIEKLIKLHKTCCED